MAIAFSSSSQHKFDVFISFRGEDTRYDFTSHLYHAFRGKKINAYIDEESLKKGDEISPALMRAIQESLISVVILSENYASSSWCLDELNHILQCKEISNQIVVPVFYGVSPSQVEKQQGSFGLAFAALEDHFKDRMDKWRNSLTQVANLKGWNSSKIESNSKLVEAILKDILEKLHHMLPYDIDFKDLVGIEKRIQHVESLLNIDSLDVRIVGIWGMGGIGKTTLARVIFNRLAYQFKSFYFLENVKKESERGLSNLQKELFSKLLLEENSNLHMGGLFVKKRLRRTKVFIVLDDVDDVDQFEYLVGRRDQFGDGSKIIVTTRDKQVLNNIGADETYKVEELDFSESQGLFCSKAFSKSAPTIHYTNLLERVVQYSGGIPLALKVLGGHLQTKSPKVWESALDKLETTPDSKVHNVLKISYDGLEKNEKEIFLDIACFFNGENEHFVKRVLDAYGNRFMDIGKERLMDKALITTTPTSMLQMHDLLQEMGREIVRDESKKPGKRSRLWLAKDIYRVLKYKMGTGVVQGMSMDLSNKDPDVKQLDPLAFKEMHNLKFIRFDGRLLYPHQHFEFPEGLEFLPDELSYISWANCPLKNMPSDFTPRNLVELHFRGSKLKHLWKNRVPNLQNLKVLDLSWSKNLIQIQDLSLAVNLEMIDLSFCCSFKSLPDLSLCANLKEISLLECSSLESLPDLSLCVNLEEIDLSFCSSLKSLPDVSLCANLKEISLRKCSSLESLPSSIGKLKSLKEICLTACKHLENVPDLSLCVNLEEINLSFCSSLKSLPDLCVNLEEIDPQMCSSLKSLIDLSLCGNLKEINLSHCYSLKNVYDLSLCVNLEEINLQKCSSLKSLPDLSLCANLKMINLSYCSSLENLPNVPVNIVVLELRECTRLKKFPITNCKLKSLETLDLSDCSELEDLPDIWKLMEGLRILDLKGSGIRELPSSIKNLIRISKLNLHDCKNLRSVPLSISNMRIEELNLFGCSNLENFYFLTCLPPSLRYLNLSHTCLSEIPDCIFSLPGLRRLSVAGTMVSTIPESIKSSKYLRYLDITRCKSVRFLPELPLCIKEIDASECTSLKLFSNTSIDAITEFQTRALCLAAAHKVYDDDYDYDYDYFHFQRKYYQYNNCKVRVCYTGDEIPKWFIHQNNDGSRVNVKLSPPNLNFTSFATSVVIAYGDVYKKGLLLHSRIELVCDICIRTNEGERHLTFKGSFNYYKDNHISNHMHLWTFEKRNIDFSSVKEISVDFKVCIDDETPLPECKVIKCGIRLLHLQDAAEYLREFFFNFQ